MKTIIVANQKGGVGKTSSARHLGWFGAERGLKVLMVDFDIQNNLSKSMLNFAIQNKRPIGHSHFETSHFFQNLPFENALQCDANIWSVACDEKNIFDVEQGNLSELIENVQRSFKQLEYCNRCE